MKTFQVDTIIRNGHVIDPARGTDGKAEVAIKDGRFVELPADAEVLADTEYDAAGCMVIPGMIDYHCHYPYGHTNTGVNANAVFVHEGVTTAVDQGSTGVANCRGFLNMLPAIDVKTRVMLQVVPQGQIDCFHSAEVYLPDKWERPRYREAFLYGAGKLIGLKMRASMNAVQEAGSRAFFESVRLADDLNTMLTVHVNNPPMLMSELADGLRPGDVMSHIYNGQGNTMFENNKVAPGVLRARERGVYMDVAHGGCNFSFAVARKAIEEGFPPDIISTDQTRLNWLHPETYSLPYVMSQMLALGMTVSQIVKAVTETPAKAIKMSGEVGTLAPGAWADVCILKLIDRPLTFQNAFKETWKGEQLFVPQATLLNGKLVYKPLDSNVLRRTGDFGWGV